MNTVFKIKFIILATAFLLCCTSRPFSADQRPDPKFITVNGVKLSYLDWGGSGPAVILLHGFMDSPHWFDRMAPELAKNYRVLAIARRGHFLSESKGPYDKNTLVEDLRQFMIALKITKASLIGWSMSNIEMTGLAGNYPEMVGKLIYLDATYDWGEGLGERMSSNPVGVIGLPDVFPSYEDWRTKIVSIIYPGSIPPGGEAQIRGIVHENPDGTVQITAGSATWNEVEVFMKVEHPDYTKVQAPALAIYAERWYPASGYDSAMQRKVDEWELKYNRPFKDSQRNKLEREMRGVKVMQIPGTTHAGLILEAHDRILGKILEFLKK